MKYPEVFLLRHGETEWNIEGRLQGHLDSPLTTRGLAQAQAQRALLAPFGARFTQAVSSPSPRALRTARIAVSGIPVALSQDARLMEIDLGDWTGHRIEDIADRHPHVRDSDDPHMWKFTAPGGERLEHMVERCHAFLAGLDGPSVLITHGVTSRLLRTILLGLPPERLSDLPGGQGMVHHVAGGKAQLLHQ